MTSNLLTHSRMSCFKTCPRKHRYEYEMGVRRDRSSQPLRMGAAFHLGLETHDLTGDPVAAIEAAVADYETPPAWVEYEDRHEQWQVEKTKVAALLDGHMRRWPRDADGLQVVATEQQFALPLVNPASGRSSTQWTLAGKMDRIVRLEDGRLAVQEYKTTSMPIDSGSDYWTRLRMDQQISLYVLAARELGHDVSAVLYDVTRKPSLRPRKLTRKESAALQGGGGWFGAELESHDRERALEAGRETPAMYGARLAADIAQRPDWYHQRREIPRLESDLDEFKSELWDLAKTMRECELHERWPRNTNACLAPYRCDYFDVCAQGVDLNQTLPDGFVQLDNVHPELET